jgi:uncharacterized protein (TIGR03437 family)
MSVFFKSDQPDLTRAIVMPEMDGFGVYPATVAHVSGKGWQVDCKIGDDAGAASRSMRVRTSESAFSEPAIFAVDAPVASATDDFSGSIQIRGVADSNTWQDNLAWLARETFVSVWVSGLPDDATKSRVRVRIGESYARVLFLSPLDPQQLRQINVRLPEELGPGEYPLIVLYGSSATQAEQLRVYSPKN